MGWKFVQTVFLAMGDGGAMFLGMLLIGLLVGGCWWVVNWMARHPRPILPGNEARPLSIAVSHALLRPDLPVVFHMSRASQIALIVLLLIPPVAAIITMIMGFESSVEFAMEFVISLLDPLRLGLACIVFLLCPFSAWNIYWRRNDFIRFDVDSVEYRSGFKTGELVPASIRMYRGWSWRFDLIDLFKGQMLSSWFVEMVPLVCSGMEEVKKGPAKVILDLKAMNLGGSARAIATLLSQVYADKFLINNELPSQGR